MTNNQFYAIIQSYSIKYIQKGLYKKMITTQRQEKILEYIKTNETVSVKQIVKHFFVSEATARRDLTALEKTGVIRRIFGGATLVVGADRQVPLFVREREDEQEKSDICARAQTLIHDGSVLFIDGSSTAQFLLPFLYKYKDLIVITNGLKIAETLGNMRIKVYCTGGFLIDNSSVLAGEDAERFLDSFNADICFLSCKGLSDDGKFSDTSYLETQLRKHFLSNAKTRVMLITKNKLGKKYLHTLCESKDIDYIFTSQPLPNITLRKKPTV